MKAQSESDPMSRHAAALPLNRRAFLGWAGGVVCGAAAARAAGAAPVGVSLRDFRLPPDGRPVLATAGGESRQAAVAAALQALGGMERFVKKGDVVLLKPDAAYAQPAALGATTHPETLEAVARLVLVAGAAEVIIADNPFGDPEATFRQNGLAGAAERVGARLMLPYPGAFRTVRMEGAALDGALIFYEPLRRATKVIGIAPCKVDPRTGAAMTAANWLGLLGGTGRERHRGNAEAMAALAGLIRPTLVVLDAMVVMTRNAPAGGKLGDLTARGIVVAGSDPAAVDAVGWEMVWGARA